MSKRSISLCCWSAIFTFVVMFGFLFPGCLLAGGGPENVVLVVNADSASSKLIANAYINGRSLPARNVIYLSEVPTDELIRHDLFIEKILKPVFQEIDLRKLNRSVDYIVYSADFPTAIRVGDHLRKLKELARKQTGRALPSQEVFSETASITSATYFATAFLKGDPGYLTLNSNSYYRQKAQVLLRQPFYGATQAKFQKTIEKIHEGTDSDYKDAITELELLAKKNPRQMAVAYWLACFHAKLGDEKSATNWLIRAIKLGWSFQKQTLADKAFDEVKDDLLFKGIVSRIPDQAFDFAPTHGFKSVYRWGANGMLNAEPRQGSSYFLSTVLAVTRNHGNSERDALRQLQLSMRADETHPEGTFYFTSTGDIRSKTRIPNFASAIGALRQMGMKANIVKTKMPVNRRDVLGLTCGTAGFNWTITGSKIVPGAFCDNLTSFGGVLYRAGQTKLTEFIANGAAGASGTVVEPYTVQAKFPHPMIHVHYARGCSLAEAYYQSVHGPFQLLVVGDALCQPWATKPKLKISGVAAGDTIKGKIKLLLDDSQSPAPIAAIQIYVDGILVHQMKLTDKIVLDTADMTDGYHEIRVVAISKSRIETTGHTIFPVRVDNQGKSVKLTPAHLDYLETDQIKFKVKSNFGDSVELMHNGRAIAKRIGRNVKFEIPAKLLGRGRCKVVAVAIGESGTEVSSMPVEIEVKGPISALKPLPSPKPKKRIKPKKIRPKNNKPNSAKSKPARN